MPSGERIIARLDAAAGLESIYVGPRLVSRSKLGAKPDGHPIPQRPVVDGAAYREAPQTLVVTYDPLHGFELRANGQLVPPTLQPPPFVPVPQGPSMAASTMLAPTNERSAVRWIVPCVLALVVAVGGAAAVRARRPAIPPAGSVMASTGLVRLNYPAGFVAEPEKSNRDKKDDPYSVGPIIATSFNSARHATHDEGVFVISARTKGTSIGRDPWVLSNQFYKDFAKTLEEKIFKEPASITETAREELTCLGEVGAAVTSTVQHGSETGTFWTCTFMHDGDAFMIGYAVNAKVAADEPTLRNVVLTQVELLPR